VIREPVWNYNGGGGEEGGFLLPYCTVCKHGSQFEVYRGGGFPVEQEVPSTAVVWAFSQPPTLEERAGRA
jgi:hypothetical protein